MHDLDVIVIGSGAGGLAAAVAAARAGKRVAVFEKHYLPGGWCHTFPLGGYRYSPGVHYLGGLQEGGVLRRLYEGLGLGEDLSFYELNPTGFDRIWIGDERFDIPKGKDTFADTLAARFPAERDGIRAYLDTVERIDGQLRGLMSLKPHQLLTLPWRARDILRWGFRTAGSLIDAHVRDPKLRAVLAGQSGDHGLPPSMVSAPVHAAVAAHYFEGGWYPKGGGGALPRAHIRALRRHGGEIHVKTPIDRILLERGRAIGVRLGDGTEVRADVVICNADPGVTFERLVGRENLGWRRRRALDRTSWSVSALSLFLAVDMDVDAAGLDSGNSWFYRDADIESIYRQGLTPWGPELDEIPGMFLTTTTLKDPSKDYRSESRRAGPHAAVHTMEAFAFVSWDAYRRWEESAVGDRPDGYRELKDKLEAKMLEGLERRVPGIRDAVVFSALGTPLTNLHYCAATNGNLYGNAKIRSQVGPFSFQTATEFPGLFLCGASTLGHGVTGAAMSGLVAARKALGCRVRDLLGEDEASITLLDAETERRRIRAERAVAAEPALAAATA